MLRSTANPYSVSASKPHIDLGEQVLKTLLYFDIFRYPLNAAEIYRFLRTGGLCDQQLKSCLETLTRHNQIFKFGELYSVHPDDENIKRRIKGNLSAAKWLKVAERKARFIAGFPFVRSVMASGSLSKGYMDEGSDLDFFIVTSPNRLWVARTLLVLYKRVFLKNSHKQFCVNYFVDADHLEIEEQNLFTATELVTLIPLYGRKGHEAVLSSNTWVREYFPNFDLRPGNYQRDEGAPALRGALEIILSPVGHLLDKFFMMISLRRWQRLYRGQYSDEDFDIAFKTRRHVSKNHPNNYQKKILERYQSKLAEFRNRLVETATYD